MLPTDHEDFLGAFPALADLDLDTRRLVLDAGQTLELTAGAKVFDAGDRCRRYILIQGGSVRVHLLDVEGHEIVLYRLRRGDTCILTTAALLGETPYAAYAVTEVPTVATALSIEVFNNLLARSPAFRRVIFATQGARIVDLMQVVSDVAFTRLSVRLSRCLLRRADTAGCVAMTHEALAVELGTAREVVSRNLKALGSEGFIRIGHGQVTILDRWRLCRLAEGSG